MISRKTKLVPYLFIFPNVLIVVLFAIYPLLANLVMSFTTGAIGVSQFNWFDHYLIMLNDRYFRIALLNTLYFVFLMTLPTVFLSLVLAIGLNRIRLMKSTLRAIYLLPHLFSWVVVGLIWRWMYSSNNGILNSILMSLDFRTSRWILDPKLTLPCLALTGIWAGVGYYAVIFLAGLQSVPSGLYEAAKIDGANSFQQFRFITVPALRPIIILVVNLVVISSFRVFDQIFVMTGGGPGRASFVMVLYIYIKGMQEGNLGYASALSVVFFLVLLLVTVILRKLTSAAEE
ncbi:MAG: carbohydrate ABC transporter permease [Christensenellales bacterium]|jgi:multiple sugar transport system permease protein